MHFMVQKQPSQQRGRPAQFNEAKVVESAIKTFWSNGYRRTTLSDLEQATGVDRSTMYNSFGGKSGLYATAASAYVQQGKRQLLSLLSDGDAGLADILSFFDLVDAIQGDDLLPAGCLIINDLANPANDEVTDEYLAALRTGLGEAIARSNRTDGTDPRHNTTRRDALFAAIIGANVTHGRNPTDSTAAEMIDGLRQLVQDWSNI
jgi:TetR/AcrR family transcriptional repressor of nem operon